MSNFLGKSTTPASSKSSSSLLSKVPAAPSPIVKLPPPPSSPTFNLSTSNTSNSSAAAAASSHSPSSSSSPGSHQGNVSPSPSFTNNNNNNINNNNNVSSSSSTSSNNLQNNNNNSPVLNGSGGNHPNTTTSTSTTGSGNNRPNLTNSNSNSFSSNIGNSKVDEMKRSQLTSSAGFKPTYRSSTTLAQLTSQSIPSNSDNSPPSSLFSSSSSPTNDSLIYHDNDQHYDANTKFGNYIVDLKVTSSNEQARSGHSCSYYDDTMFIYGGLTSDSTPTNDFYSFNFSTKSWSSLNSGPTPRSYHTSVIYNNSMYVFGGDGGNSGLKNDFTYTQLWSELFTEGQRPSARFGHSAVVDGNQMLVFGGVAGSQLSNDVYSLNLETKSWTLVVPASAGPVPSARSFHTATLHKGVMYVIGGQDSTTNALDDIHFFTIATNTWRPLVIAADPNSGNSISSTFTSRSHHAAALLQDSIIVTGGNTARAIQPTLDIFELDLFQKRWFRIQTNNHGQHRSSHSLIIKSNSLYIWGGCSDSTLDYLSFGKDDFEDINQEDDVELNRIQNIPKALWESTLMKKHPEILEYRERTQLLTGVKSYGRTLAQPSFTENKNAISHQFVLQLIMEYLERHTAYHKSIKAIEEEARVLHAPTDTSEARLVTLLRLVKPRLKAKNVLDPELSIYKTTEQFDEEVQVVDNLYRRIETEEDVNIWDDVDPRNIRKNEAGSSFSIKAGTLNKLVQHLSLGENNAFVKSFLYTHQSFTTSENLLKKLIQRYNGPVQTNVDQPRVKQDVIEQNRKKVADVIKYWIDKCPWDFKSGPSADKLVASLNNFIDGPLTRDGNRAVANLRRALVQVRTNETGQQVYSTSSNPPEPKVPKNIFSPQLTLAHIDDLEIARQLTLIEYKLFRNIPPPEFLVKVTPYGDFQYSAATSPNLIAYLNRSSDVSKWVAHTILSLDQKKARVKMIEKYFKIMESLRSLNNFQTLYSIYQGLQHPYVQTVPDLFTLRSKELLMEYDSLFSKNDSFKTYRDTLQKSVSPCIPLIYVVQEDISFIETQQPPLMGLLINFVKRQNLFNIVSKVEAYQQTYYNLQPVHQISTFVNKLPKVSETELLELSKKKTNDI
ncbi:Ras guanine nucleotide exchange factor [Heterostelium album PN500]|uniref:Ras guanine nucleotide exchange factor n=1 Tax=Heterostelium pallidum (strain ATCC 26659 / Pp 5 / PN500) TaxID=670386 RepID=D3BBI3_HETP5|nr:Ras guanine nucleotide exchange factor [Heterostelium album PN500]EFA81016.1 Ras guanine nucleotide exchange factor [Heterostelium album PN500]|eukprot:XP_020433134.1 Ras guanine nucleotide exchange factor [Heterostelium album PN500]